MKRPAGALPFSDPANPQVIRAHGPLEIHAEVGVIGSGAGGATFASELAERGFEVALLEMGPYITRKQMTQRERDMLPLFYEDVASQTTADGGIVILHAHCVGGTTVVNNAICFDPPAWLLDEWADRHDVAGARRADVAAANAKVNFILNVQKIAPDQVNQNARVMMRGTERIGVAGDTFHHNRTECLLAGFCMLGCAYDRKQNHHITYVPRALSYGARLYPEAHIDRLISKGQRVVEAVGTVRDPVSGKQYPLSLKADAFVVAGGAVWSPALLLKSGLGNDQVGRNFHCHPIAAIAADMGDETIRAYEGIPQCYYVDQYLQDQGFVLESIFAGPSVSAALLPAWGPSLQRLMGRYEHLASAYVQLRDEDSGRIRVDSRGVPVIDYSLSPRDAQKSLAGLKILSRIFLAAGAQAAYLPSDSAPIRTEADIAAMSLDFSPCRVSLVSAHQMGSLRMGEDPGFAAVNSQGKVFGTTNLYVADASVFPTALGLNPQITVATLATHFASQFSRPLPV